MLKKSYVSEENEQLEQLEKIIVPIEIEGISGYYISNYGEVYSEKSGKLKQLQPRLRGNRKIKDNMYECVILYRKGKKKDFPIHRLVALHFVPNPNGYDVVDHIDNNKYNNKASNLRWVTQKENVNNPNSNITKPIARYTTDGEYLDSAPSITTYNEKYGYSVSNISNCLVGRHKTAYKCKFCYLNKEDYNNGKITIQN